MSTEQDIIDFFKPMKVDQNIINLTKNAKGFTNGEAYLEFAKFSEATRSLSYNKQTIADRYIEVFKSSNPIFFKNFTPIYLQIFNLVKKVFITNYVEQKYSS